eukprot:3147700-Rhodomonas_salina.2
MPTTCTPAPATRYQYRLVVLVALSVPARGPGTGPTLARRRPALRSYAGEQYHVFMCIATSDARPTGPVYVCKARSYVADRGGVSTTMKRSRRFQASVRYALCPRNSPCAGTNARPVSTSPEEGSSSTVLLCVSTARQHGTLVRQYCCQYHALA